MNGKMLFHPLIGDQVTVNIPEGLPDLMMDVCREVLRNPPGDGQLEIISFIADYLDRLMEARHDKNVMDVVTDLTKTNEEIYLDELKQAHADEELNKLATIIQQNWRKYKGYNRGDFAAKNVCTDGAKTLTGSKFKMLNGDNVPCKTANKAAATIHKAWRKYTSTKRFRTEGMEELDFESVSDDMECVNVVRKGQIHYVPPIPDFINDSFKSPSMTDVFDVTEGEETDDH